MRLADFVAARLTAAGITDVFMVTGGGAMHLNDALARQPGLRVHHCHHEQACAMAAEGYARIAGRPAAVNVTSGPGGTNAITGVMGAWTDSVPMVVISGQVKRETMVANSGLPLRQLGDQEADIVALVQGITKYAAVVNDPAEIDLQLDEAIALSMSGRPGPVWLDIPSDVQAADIDAPDVAQQEAPRQATAGTDLTDPSMVQEVLSAVSRADRPVVLAGGGIWASGSHPEFLELVDRLRVPVVTAWNAHDLIWDEHPLYAGRPGTVGTRPGNFAVQNADLVLVLGCRLNIRQIGYAWKTWARAARVIMVDVDRAELDKPTLHVDTKLNMDLRRFFKLALDLPYHASARHERWMAWCADRVKRYPAVLPRHRTSDAVNPYLFVERLTTQLPEGQVSVTGDGTACVVTFQAAVVKRSQRLFSNSGTASMGYDLPAAIGAAIALGGDTPVVCLAGDGSLMMNLQELATIRGYKLPVKVFVLNNSGYHSIRQTQHNYFEGREVGCGEASGLWFPSIERLARAFDLPYSRIENHEQVDDTITSVLRSDGPVVTEVVIDLAQQFEPKASSRLLPDGTMVSAPLEDLAPFLPASELESNMLIPLVDP